MLIVALIDKFMGAVQEVATEYFTSLFEQTIGLKFVQR